MQVNGRKSEMEDEESDKTGVEKISKQRKESQIQFPSIDA